MSKGQSAGSAEDLYQSCQEVLADLHDTAIKHSGVNKDLMAVHTK